MYVTWVVSSDGLVHREWSQWFLKKHRESDALNWFVFDPNAPTEKATPGSVTCVLYRSRSTLALSQRNNEREPVPHTPALRVLLPTVD